MPADRTLPQPTSRTRREAQKKPSRWFPWTSLLLVSGLFFGVYVVLDAPREIGRWHLAAANEHWTEAEYAALQGDKARAAENRDKAFAKMEDALKWSPEEPKWLLQRAQWKLDAFRGEAALYEVNALIAKNGEAVGPLELRALISQKLGKHGDAVKDLETVNNISKVSGDPPRATALNSLAYARAIGRIELDSALKEISEALKSDGNYALLDTRGFIYYRQGKYDLAMKDLDPAAVRAEQTLALFRQHIAKHVRNVPDVRNDQLNEKKIARDVAVVLYHRSLAHDKLHHTAAAQRDRKRVRELIGREGDEKLF